MREDPITLTQKEQKRLRVINEVEAGRWTVAEAAQSLQLSQRQVRRLRRRFLEEGARALMHGNRGRPSPHRLSDDLRVSVIGLGGGRYAACNDSHLQELLAQERPERKPLPLPLESQSGRPLNPSLIHGGPGVLATYPATGGQNH